MQQYASQNCTGLACRNAPFSHLEPAAHSCRRGLRDTCTLFQKVGRVVESRGWEAALNMGSLVKTHRDAYMRAHKRAE